MFWLFLRDQAESGNVEALNWLGAMAAGRPLPIGEAKAIRARSELHFVYRQLGERVAKRLNRRKTPLPVHDDEAPTESFSPTEQFWQSSDKGTHEGAHAHRAQAGQRRQ